MAGKASFHWDDPLLLEQQLSDDERAVRDAARSYCQERLAPRVVEAFRHEKTDPAIFREMGELALLGPTIPEAYGGIGAGYLVTLRFGGEVAQVDMAVGMVAHFVAFGGDGAHGLRVAGYTRAEYEERRLDVALAQDAEKPGSVWPGAVIEGDGACVCVRSEHGKREPVENFFGVRRDGAGKAEQGAQEREGGVGHVSLSIMRVYGHVLRPQDQLSQKCKASYRGRR